MRGRLPGAVELGTAHRTGAVEYQREVQGHTIGVGGRVPLHVDKGEDGVAASPRAGFVIE